MTTTQRRSPRRIHIRYWCCFSVLLSIIALVFAGSPRLVSSWKNPVAGPLDRTKERVAAFFINSDETFRLGREETIATELRDRGLDCVAGYTVLPAELSKDQERSKEFLSRAGITSVIILRLVSVEEQENVTSIGVSWYTGPYYSSFSNYWNYGWAAAYTPVYTEVETVISFETLLFSVTQDQLLWAGRSGAVDPKDVRKLVKKHADEVGKALRKAGLVAE